MLRQIATDSREREGAPYRTAHRTHVGGQPGRTSDVDRTNKGVYGRSRTVTELRCSMAPLDGLTE